MPKHGKKFENALKNIDLEKTYEPKEALKLVKENSFARFDETVKSTCARVWTPARPISRSAT
jgi:large subunit ribosomal protein L1